MLSQKHSISFLVILLSVSSLTLKVIFVTPSLRILPESKSYLAPYLGENKYEFVDSWLLVQGSDYQILKYEPVNKQAHCASEMLIIDMHHSAELVAMLDHSINKANEELIYFYRGQRYKQFPQFQVLLDNYKIKLPLIFNDVPHHVYAIYQETHTCFSLSEFFRPLDEI